MNEYEEMERCNEMNMQDLCIPTKFMPGFVEPKMADKEKRQKEPENTKLLMIYEG